MRALFFAAAIGGIVTASAWPREAPRFTGAHIAADGGPKAGWDVAPLPGLRLGVEAEAAPSRATAVASPGRWRKRDLYAGGRFGAMLGRSTFIYVKAGYERGTVAGATSSRSGRGVIRVGAGIEHMTTAEASVRTELLYSLAEPEATRRTTTEELVRHI